MHGYKDLSNGRGIGIRVLKIAPPFEGIQQAPVLSRPHKNKKRQLRRVVRPLPWGQESNERQEFKHLVTPSRRASWFTLTGSARQVAAVGRLVDWYDARKPIYKTYNQHKVGNNTHQLLYLALFN